MIIEILVRKYF